MLNDQTACFQRGYCPAAVYRSALAVFAQGFNHSIEGVTDILHDNGFDFIIAIRGHGSREIAAACLVELRCSAAHADDVPYLYVYELTTNRTYGRHGLAQQMVHAVDALAYLMKSDTDPGSIWTKTLQGKRLFMGLTVDKTQEPSYTSSLVKLYSRAGMRERTSTTPRIDYTSFSAFSSHEWCIDKNTQHYTAMWKEITLPSVYDDGVVRIFKDLGENTDTNTLFYHAFPKDKLGSVEMHGIVHPLHRCLHSDAEVYIAPGKTLTFTRHKHTASDNLLFVVRAECPGQSFEVHTSIPSWFAYRTHDDTAARLAQ